jgi:hypothetical protein
MINSKLDKYQTAISLTNPIGNYKSENNTV